MKRYVYAPLLDSSKKFLKLKRVHRYHMKKISDMSDVEIIRVCHFYVHEHNLLDEWEMFREQNEVNDIKEGTDCCE